jgi:hypothetical protein
MFRDFFFELPEDQTIVLVQELTLRTAEELIEGCEKCDPEADIPFDTILDWLTGGDPRNTEYLIRRQARCPTCRSEFWEKTVVTLRQTQIVSSDV